MATKKENKRHVVRRVRYALNRSTVPPTAGSNKHIRSGYGKGAGLRDVDANDGSNDPDVFAYMNEVGSGCEDAWDPECCDVCTWCPFYVDALSGNGWTLDQSNDNNPPKLGDLLAA